MDKFKEYIDRVGQKEFAEKLGVSKTAVWFWRHGRFRPSISNMDGPSMVHRIIELSNGELELEDIRPDIFEGGR